MTSMLSVGDRRAHEMEILDYYLAILHRFGGPKLNTEDEELTIEFRRSFMSNIVWLICPEGLHSKERIAALCERVFVSLADHATFEVIEAQTLFHRRDGLH